jgi:hypothetical protein
MIQKCRGSGILLSIKIDEVIHDLARADEKWRHIAASYLDLLSLRERLCLPEAAHRVFQKSSELIGVGE